jgi:hypothetical protein
LKRYLGSPQNLSEPVPWTVLNLVSRTTLLLSQTVAVVTEWEHFLLLL